MADLNALLEQSSRTFALTIPFLPEPTRREVTVAYLLFRIADTLEDGESWDRAQRGAALRLFEQVLLAQAPTQALSPLLSLLEATPPTQHAGYRALLAETVAVFEALAALGQKAREVIVRHLLVTVRGMAEGLEQSHDDAFRLRSLTQLQRYCYLVAGVVGEMLTELFLLESKLPDAAETLRSHARAFGEGLQLTNILKDEGDDAREERHFLPDAVPRASLFALARVDLGNAARYVAALVKAKAPEGVVAFTALPVRLALDTLALVERKGAGAKVSREQLATAIAEVGELLRGEKNLETVLPL